MNYIDEQMRFYAGNISEFEIGNKIIRKNGDKCEITNMTKNSLEVYFTKSGKDGINCKQWFTAKDFQKQFKKLIWNS